MNQVSIDEDSLGSGVSSKRGQKPVVSLGVEMGGNFSLGSEHVEFKAIGLWVLLDFVAMKVGDVGVEPVLMAVMASDGASVSGGEIADLEAFAPGEELLHFLRGCADEIKERGGTIDPFSDLKQLDPARSFRFQWCGILHSAA